MEVFPDGTSLPIGHKDIPAWRHKFRVEQLAFWKDKLKEALTKVHELRPSQVQYQTGVRPAEEPLRLPDMDTSDDEKKEEKAHHVHKKPRVDAERKAEIEREKTARAVLQLQREEFEEMKLNDNFDEDGDMEMIRFFDGSLD